MPELGSLGSVRGALSNGRPYRERKGPRHSEMPDRKPASLCRGQSDAPREGPMVRILFPPAASQQRTVPAVGFDGGESTSGPA